MNPIELCARFSYMPNKLGYCGPSDANKIFYEYIIEKDQTKISLIKESLKNFEALYPYLKFIAEKNDKKPFDYDVVEAYWLGNSLLDNIKSNEVTELIKKLVEQGLLQSIADNLIKSARNKNLATPNHLFNVIFVGVGAITRSVETNIENMDKCRISWGRVLQVFDNHLIVEHNRLKYDNKYFLSDKKEKIKVFYDKKIFLEDIKERDVIAVHWQFGIKKLNDAELNNLKKYTKKVINLVNS